MDISSDKCENKRMTENNSGMYPIIIVDDETTIRKGMVKCIDWNSIGFAIATEASDGLEAVRLVEELHPTVVLTDIRMENMDGMELIEWLYDKHPEIKVILVSGYSELEYYKKALQCKIFDYLLKPTRIETIKDVFHKLKTILDEEKAKEALLSSMQDRLDSSIPLARTRLLSELASGMTPMNIAESLNKLGLLIPQGPYRLAAFSPERSIESYAESIEKLEDYYKKPFVAVDGTIISFCPGTEINMQKDELLAIAEKLKNITNIEFAIAVSSAGEGGESIGRCLNEAVIATNEYLFSTERPEVINYDDIAASWAHPENIYEYDVSGIVSAVENGEKGEIERSVNKLIDALKDNPVPYGYLSCLMSRIYYGVSRRAWKIHAEIPRYQEFKRKFDAEHSLDTKTEILMDMLLSASMAITQGGAGGRLSLAREIDRIIEEGYMQNAMSLTYIAEHTGKSEAYISNLYKTERDQNILERITDLRMKKAREELSGTDMKIYEIARSIGYIDASYFCKLFRKHEGVSPAEYRRTH